MRVWTQAPPPWAEAVSTERRVLWYASPEEDDRREPSLLVWQLADGSYFQFRYVDGTEFYVDAAGREIWARWPAPLTLEDAATYLVGPILGFVLRLRGVTCLHASVLAMGGRACALVGPAAAGKSTLAAALALQGCAVLSDDVAVLEEHGELFFVQPGYARLNLWPASVAAVCGSPEALPKITPNWDKRYLQVEGPALKFEDGPLPLAATYLLAPRRFDSRAPFIEEVAQREGLLELLANTYQNDLLEGRMRAADFERVGRLQARVPLRRAVAHADPARLPAFAQAVLDDFLSLTHSVVSAVGRVTP